MPEEASRGLNQILLSLQNVEDADIFQNHLKLSC